MKHNNNEVNVGIFLHFVLALGIRGHVNFLFSFCISSYFFVAACFYCFTILQNLTDQTAFILLLIIGVYIHETNVMLRVGYRFFFFFGIFYMFFISSAFLRLNRQAISDPTNSIHNKMFSLRTFRFWFFLFFILFRSLAFSLYFSFSF